MSSSPASHQDMANAIRALSMDAVEKAASGHVGMPLGMADVATILYTKHLKYDPKAPKWADRDRFVLSAGHGSMLIYSLLYLTGYESVSLSDIENFRQLGAATPGHPENFVTEGVETTTGPLGQGIATAVGMAIAERHLNAKFGDDVVDHNTWVIAGDGCLMEGVSQEAITLAGHMKLNKLIVLWDDNNVTIDGTLDVADETDQIKRFEAAGWAVAAIDGHDPTAIDQALEWAKSSDRPVMIACKTRIGYGAPTIEGTGKAHGGPYGASEIEGIRKNIGWDHAPFVVPEDVLTTWREAGARGAATRTEWEGRLAASDKQAEFTAAMDRVIPAELADAMKAHKQSVSDGQDKKATRQWSGAALEVATKILPTMIGGSADLTGSNNTKTSSTGPLTSGDYAGRYIHYGVREHGMASAMNGMALHGGVIPYSGTFFVFSDYSRAAIRLGALMGAPVIHVMTHDSIGLGEDGPTHQPVEHLASFRAMPNIHVFRPADGVETAECWELALARTDGPSMMVLTRQGLAPARSGDVSENKSAKGGYVLSEAEGDAQLVIVATGSEVEIALAAQESLKAEGIAARVVSLPCWEIFAEQDEAYIDDVLGGDLPKLAVEAGVRTGWDQWIGRKGGFVGMNSFGASAPYKDLFKHFGITAEGVVAAAKALV
ncbi:transketolase [Ponticaulis sp.]|uniref:transketolase n=1 Tax=Ponticaulis sp. TaxID=2020902 RepID=UPI000B67BF61|nr:transketolase [Ponticaulis sp.]MAJ07858.1 transketolase [Ponticaulis sp.]RPG18173.1 MAG: transketolase [Hyphomonadaceae bacterium TMED125]HBH88837.1 transketolase [Hyphomonadaceae bacterium]